MSIARLSRCSIGLFNLWIFLFKFRDSYFVVLLFVTNIHESPTAGAVLVAVALPECLAVIDDRSGLVAVLNDVPLLYLSDREDRMIEPSSVIAAVNGLARVTARRLGSGVDASQLPTQAVYFGCQLGHLRLLGIDLLVLSLRHHVLVLVLRRYDELVVSDLGMQAIESPLIAPKYLTHRKTRVFFEKNGT